MAFFFFLISLLGTGMAQRDRGGEQQEVGAGRREETAVFKASGPQWLLHPAQDWRGFHIIKEANLLSFSPLIFFFFFFLQRTSLCSSETLFSFGNMQGLSGHGCPVGKFPLYKIIGMVFLRDWWELVMRPFERGSGRSSSLSENVSRLGWGMCVK